MENDQTVGVILTVAISIGALALSNLIDFGDKTISWLVLFSAIVIIFIIFSINSINKNSGEIQKLKIGISGIRKDLNISERLSKIEARLEK